MMHIHLKMKTFLLRVSDPGDTTDANFTQWTNNTNCPTVLVAHKFTGSRSGF